jgi:hypothetical protein
VSCLIVSCLIVFPYRTVPYFVSCRAVYTLLNVSCRVVPYSRKNEHGTLKTRHETRHGTYHVPCLNRAVSLSCRIVRTVFSHGGTVLRTLSLSAAIATQHHQHAQLVSLLAERVETIHSIAAVGKVGSPCHRHPISQIELNLKSST